MGVRLAISRVPGTPQVLAKKPLAAAKVEDPSWRVLGLRLEKVSRNEIRKRSDKFRGGLRVVEVDEDGMSAAEGIREGDLLVGVHVWETVDLENLDYIFEDANFEDAPTVPFYILREDKTFAGSFQVSKLR